MSRFEQINDLWYWRALDGSFECLSERADNMLDILEYSGFREFLGELGGTLERYMFEPEYIYVDDYTMSIRYVCGLKSAVRVLVLVNMQDGSIRSLISYCFHAGETFESFQKHHADYFATCDEILATRAGLASARVRMAQLEDEVECLIDENTHLRYRPGGPGYDETAAHFAALTPK